MASDNAVITVLGAGKLILLLLALGGIALWIDSVQTSQEVEEEDEEKEEEEEEEEEEVFAKEEEEEVQEDYLSELPDDVLSSILANLTLIDAVRTSILSTRWKYLFASMPTLKFRCLDMSGVNVSHHYCCPYYKHKFMKRVFQFLQLYSGRRVTHIEMVCCFAGQIFSEFSHWLSSISRLGVERLHVSFESNVSYPIRDSNKLLKFSVEIISKASSLKDLFLSGCILLSSPKVHLNSLVTLALRGVVLPSGQLEGILLSCSKLKELTIVNSKLPYKLRLASTVTIVVILACDGGEEIDIHAAYLHTLECKIYNNVRFFFSLAPMLENLMICPWESASHSYIFGDFCPWGSASNSYIFGDFARDLPDQVKSLTVNLSPFEVINYSPTEIKIFRNLRKLSLILAANNHKSFDMVKLYPLLGASPLLQYLSLMAGKNWTVMDESESRRPPLSPTCFTELKQVTFGGFYGTESDMEFVLYILRSAIVLERMFLTPRYKVYFDLARRKYFYVPLDETKCDSIQQKLHGQAISTKAVVIIQ